MAAISVHVLLQTESPDNFKKLCPVRNQAISTTVDHTNLLPNGDGFDWSVYDKEHNAVWFRDSCPIDTYITQFVGVLPAWTSASVTKHAGLTGYVLAKAVWDDLFLQAMDWLQANVKADAQRSADEAAQQRSAVENVLPTIILNWFISQNYVVLTATVP